MIGQTLMDGGFRICNRLNNCKHTFENCSTKHSTSDVENVNFFFEIKKNLIVSKTSYSFIIISPYFFVLNNVTNEYLYGYD